MERRSFLRWATHALGALFGAVLGIPAIGYLTDPRNRSAAQDEFKAVGRFSELVVNVPKAAVLRDIRLDAWTLHPDDVLGRVWLVYRGAKDDKGRPLVEAFTTICPHLGGPINYDPACNCFVCPLHGATFDAHAQRVLAKESDPSWINPAPRDMDSLAVELEPDPAQPDDFVIKVRYQNFIQGREEKTPKV